MTGHRVEGADTGALAESCHRDENWGDGSRFISHHEDGLAVERGDNSGYTAVGVWRMRKADDIRVLVSDEGDDNRGTFALG